ncbi:hypothetical protein ACQWHJ_24355, partial [Salmonella enterica subsp. enterica serovar Infantis]
FYTYELVLHMKNDYIEVCDLIFALVLYTLYFFIHNFFFPGGGGFFFKYVWVLIFPFWFVVGGGRRAR